MVQCLGLYLSNFIKLGIDPCDDSYLETSTSVADSIVQDYFSKDAYDRTGHGDKKCKVITTIAMFYDLDNPTDFIMIFTAYWMTTEFGLSKCHIHH